MTDFNATKETDIEIFLPTVGISFQKKFSKKAAFNFFEKSSKNTSR